MADTTSAIQGMLGSGLATSTDTTSSTSSSSAFDMNSFLTMFVTQLKYQDPTNPMESYELASQLAQFSTVAKLTEATTLLTSLQNYAASINNATMSSLVGKEVTANKSTIDVTADNVDVLEYRLDEAAASVTVTVTDSNGNVVHTSTTTGQDAGDHEIGWDGKDASGNRVASGAYNCTVLATYADGSTASLQTTVHGQVYSCNLNPTNPYFVLSGASGTKLPASSVYEVAAQDSSTSLQ